MYTSLAFPFFEIDRQVVGVWIKYTYTWSRFPFGMSSRIQWKFFSNLHENQWMNKLLSKVIRYFIIFISTRSHLVYPTSRRTLNRRTFISARTISRISKGRVNIFANSNLGMCVVTALSRGDSWYIFAKEKGREEVKSKSAWHDTWLETHGARVIGLMTSRARVI